MKARCKLCSVQLVHDGGTTTCSLLLKKHTVEYRHAFGSPSSSADQSRVSFYCGVHEEFIHRWYWKCTPQQGVKLQTGLHVWTASSCSSVYFKRSAILVSWAQFVRTTYLMFESLSAQFQFFNCFEQVQLWRSLFLHFPYDIALWCWSNCESNTS